MSTTSVALAKGADPALLTDTIAKGKDYPLAVVVTSTYRKTIVIAQAQPPLILVAANPVTHTCHTRAQLYDIVFGMLDVASTTGQVTIGSIDTTPPKGKKK